MKKLISLFLVFLLMFATLQVRADDVVLPEVPDAILTPMEKDDKAPYQGVLLSPDAIANIIADYKAFGDKLKVELDRVKAEEDANKRFELGNLTATCEADKKIIRAEADDAERRNVILVKEQKRLEKSEKSVKTWALLGLAAGVLAGGLSFYGVSSLVK